MNWLTGERSEPIADFSLLKHYRGVRSMARKPGVKFQQDRSSRSIVMAKKPVCLFQTIYICPTLRINLSLNGIQLQRLYTVVDKARDLGVWVDNKLSFANHAASAASKASRVSAVVFRTFTNRDPFFYRLAYLGYVRPILLYNSTVFNSHSAKADNLLEHVQQAFTRKIFWRCHLPKTSYEERLAFLDLDKLCVEREAIDLTTIHKLFHLEGGERSEFSDALLVMHDQGESRSARVYNQFQLRSDFNTDFNTALRRKSLNNRAKSRWNSLPTNLMSLKPDSFKDNVLKIIRSPISRPSNVKS